MSRDIVALLLFAVAGFLVGGAISTVKKSRGLAVALGAAALVAGGGAVLWLS
ncbi:hypothetical protein [Saccharomonospora piscinae]|uniref:hypothetical protein n=1 Tax=Saccharomonospora piscinae TaxID=687388 RepID=UPI0004B1667B|nr:hypothetical protein [Saccharomonospora piscinae]